MGKEQKDLKMFIFSGEYCQHFFIILALEIHFFLNIMPTY